jgi:tetratricopeptide (TPR) repeat protein
MKMTYCLIVVAVFPWLLAVHIQAGIPAVSPGQIQTIEPETIRTVEQALSLADRFVERGFKNGEESAPRENMAWADKYFARAEDLVKKEQASLLLYKGWVAFKRGGESRAARQMLQEGLKLDPDNPRALYKVAFAELETYFGGLVGRTVRPQRTERLPDGNVVNLEPIYLEYSPDQDNSKLEYARELLEKAVAIDPTLAMAYYELGHIHGFKKDESSLGYNIMFLKYRDSIDMELIFYNEGTKRQLIKNALQSVKLRAPEKLKELGLEGGYTPIPTPSPAP